jgi:O-antigen/teichoic acid export membrane protein
MRNGDDDWNAAERNETPMQRLDRNWTELLQELRVLQTGVQLLTGFLLTLPFQQRFSTLDTAERTVYLLAVSAALIATAFLTAPVSMHRALFRQHRRREAVGLAHRMAVIGMAALGCAIIMVTLLIFEVLLGWVWGVVAAAVCAALLVTVWLVVPLSARDRERI